MGARQFNTFGSHGSADYVNYRHFPTLQECCRYLKKDRGKQPERYLFSSYQRIINSASMYGDSMRGLHLWPCAAESPRLHVAGCRVIGVEITEDAQPIQAHPFTGPTAFMLGNEVPRVQHVPSVHLRQRHYFCSASALIE